MASVHGGSGSRVLADFDRRRKLAVPLGDEGTSAATPSFRSEELGAAPLSELLRRYKARIIREALDAAEGNQRVAAAQLGMHRPSLTRMIRDLQLKDREVEEG